MQWARWLLTLFHPASRGGRQVGASTPSWKAEWWISKPCGKSTFPVTRVLYLALDSDLGSGKKYLGLITTWSRVGWGKCSFRHLKASELYRTHIIWREVWGASSQCSLSELHGHAQEVNAAVLETRGCPSDFPPVGTVTWESHASSLPDPINTAMGMTALAMERPLTWGLSLPFLQTGESCIALKCGKCSPTWRQRPEQASCSWMIFSHGESYRVKSQVLLLLSQTKTFLWASFCHLIKLLGMSPGRAILFLFLFSDSAGTFTDFLKIKTKISVCLCS